MTKSYTIDKWSVYRGWQSVKHGKGGPGIDGQTIEEFEEKWKDNLYKLWNRMSSGSYMPHAVKRVSIPKKAGGERVLGVPAVCDRIAQATARDYLESRLDPLFHKDSYGYRPGKSAHQALTATRQRCFTYEWVIDMDIKGFFDCLDHDRVLEMLKPYTEQEPWIQLYVSRWLKAPIKDEEGNTHERNRGTPQGGVISPLLANLYLHEAFDSWMQALYPEKPFERYADDVIIHCGSEREAQNLLSRIRSRMQEYGLELHPDKTRIAYCGNKKEYNNYKNRSFTFLGYDFKVRGLSSGKGKVRMGFTPGISRQAKKSIGDEIRDWQLHRRTGSSLKDLADDINAQVRGWINYYGKFRPSDMNVIYYRIDEVLCKWARKKHKLLNKSRKQSWVWLKQQRRSTPRLLVHWHMRSYRTRTSGAV